MLPLGEHRVAGGLPGDVYVVNEFISREEEEELLRILTAPAARWHQVSGRQVQIFGTTVC